MLDSERRRPELRLHRLPAAAERSSRPTQLVADGYLPAEPRAPRRGAGVDFDVGLPAAPAAARRRRAPGTRSGRSSRPVADAIAPTPPARRLALAAAGPARDRLARSAVRRAAVRRARDPLRRDRPDLPHSRCRCGTRCSGTAPSSATSCTTSSGETASSARRWSAPSCTSALASLLCLLIAYPVAYFTARFAGRWKGLLLAALIAPFWISYMMRMLAWVNLLQTDGLVNRALSARRAVRRQRRLAARARRHGDPRPGLRLRAVHDPAAVRRAGPDPGQRCSRLPATSAPSRFGDVPPGDLAAEPAGGRGQPCW